MVIFKEVLGEDYLEIFVQNNITAIRQASFRFFNKQRSIKELLTLVSSNTSLDDLRYHRYLLINRDYYDKENEIPEGVRVSLYRAALYKDPVSRDDANRFIAGNRRLTGGCWYPDLFPGAFDHMAVSILSNHTTSAGVKVQRGIHLLLHQMQNGRIIDPTVFKLLWETGVITAIDY